MSTTITPTTIDLGDLLAFRAEVAEILPSLRERLDADDPEAYTEASEILAREDALVESVVARFADFEPTGGKADTEDKLRDAISALGATGDLCVRIDEYNDRRLERAVQRHLAVFVASLKSDPDAGPWGGDIADLIAAEAARLARPVTS